MKLQLALALGLAVMGCKKTDEAAPATGSADPAAKQAEPHKVPAPAAEPTAPPPTPVDIPEAELNPTCAKVMPVEVAAKAFAGATAVNESMAKNRLAICEAKNGEEVIGSLTIACKPGLDPSSFAAERAAMTKAVDLDPKVVRAGYRISNVFFVLDDETPCRLQIAFVAGIADDAWPAAVRAIMAQVTPANLK